MKNQMFLKLFTVVLVWVVVVGVSFGQAVRTLKSPLKIRKFSAMGTRSLVTTPQYKSDIARGSGSAKKWHQITVLYDTEPEWLDELTIEFHVLSSTRDLETKKDVYSLYKLVVRYADIESGRGHMATAFLRPTALKRFGNPIAVAAVFSVKGRVIDAVSEDTKKMPEKWWKDPRVTDRNDVTARNDYLLDRSKSPWALINIDNYEAIK